MTYKASGTFLLKQRQFSVQQCAQCIKCMADKCRSVPSTVLVLYPPVQVLTPKHVLASFHRHVSLVEFPSSTIVQSLILPGALHDSFLVVIRSLVSLGTSLFHRQSNYL